MYNVEHQPYNNQNQDSRSSQYPSQMQNSHFPSHPPQQQNRNNGRQAQEEASLKKAAAETKYFWALVAKGNQKRIQNNDENDTKRNPHGNYKERNQQNKAREELTLFGNSSGDALQTVPQGTFQDVPMGIIPEIAEGDINESDPILVERVGLGEENIPILENFDELKNVGKYKIPDFIINNIGLMKYQTPTPIQKHSIPLGIAGYDLMCCAQTGSGKTFSFLLPVVSALFFSKFTTVSDSIEIHPSEKTIGSSISDMESFDSTVSSQNRSPQLREVVHHEGEGEREGETDREIIDTNDNSNNNINDSDDNHSSNSNSSSSDDNNASGCPQSEHSDNLSTPSGDASMITTLSPQSRMQKNEEVQGLDERGCLPKGIILAPTRELVCQINIEAKKLCYNSNIKSVVIYGGTDVRTQLLELSSGCDLIVATPGRLFDLVERGVISFCKVVFLVLDEADRMLDMGFEPQIRKIIMGKDMPPKECRQTFLFSATFPDVIKNLARNFLRENYIFISVGRVGSTVKNIIQRLVQCSSDQNMKIQQLMNTIKEIEGRTLIFVQKKKTATWVNSYLRNLGIKSEEIHGNCTQLQRENSLRNFKNGNNLILIATDVAARGLDVPSVTHVIQFDMPMSSEDFDTYVHRIGRTGRAGKNGVATSFYVPGRAGEGNAGIASQLLTLMSENRQTIPEWFTNLNENRYGNNNFSRRPAQNKGPQQGENIWGGGKDQTRGYQNQNQNQQNSYNNGSGNNNGYNNRSYGGGNSDYGGGGGDNGNRSQATGGYQQRQQQQQQQQQQMQEYQSQHQQGQYQQQQQQQHQQPYIQQHMHQTDQYVQQYSNTNNQNNNQNHSQSYNQSHNHNQNQSYVPSNRGGSQSQNQNQLATHTHTPYYNPYAYQAQPLALTPQRVEGMADNNFNNQMSNMNFNQSVDTSGRGGGNEVIYRMQGHGQVSNQQGQGQIVNGGMTVRTVPNNTRMYAVPNGVQSPHVQHYIPQQQQQQQQQETYNPRAYVPRQNE